LNCPWCNFDNCPRGNLNKWGGNSKKCWANQNKTRVRSIDSCFRIMV
jgi:hypothetical protein